MKFPSFLFVVLLLLLAAASAKYPDNHSCAECHEKIVNEFQHSAHSWGYFKDPLHRKIADKISSKKYDCAPCHMPMADNMEAIVTGKARPNPNNTTHTDAVSCYFCHTIAYVKKAHRFNINVMAHQADHYKPTLYGRLDGPDHNDQHSSVNNPIYAQKVCTGCHSHKLNENNVTIFHAMQEGQTSESCIRCHMPEVSGGSEKMDRRSRGHHASHRFLGIHDAEFRKTGLDINVTASSTQLNVSLHNKMDHPLIIQSARAKYLHITLSRGKKVLWQNYHKDPREDKQGYFGYHFKKDGKPIVIPYHATEGLVHNLGAQERQTLHYKIPVLKKGDKIVVTYYVQLAKTDCAKAVNLTGSPLTHPEVITKVLWVAP